MNFKDDLVTSKTSWHVDFLKSPSSCVASRLHIFYPEIHEVDLWQVYMAWYYFDYSYE